jgi:hypothetical protein
MADARQPSFGTAFLAVLAGAAISSWLAALFVGFAPASSPEAWSILTSLFGAVGVKLVLRVLGYEVPLAFAAGALLAGRVASLALVQSMPDLGGDQLVPSYGVLSTVPSLVLSAFLVQICSARTRVETY